MTEGILIGSVDEIWTHSAAYRALATWRHCMDAMQRLTDHGQGIFASWIKAIVMQDVGGDPVPFSLDELAEFMVTDSMARSYWTGCVKDDRFPHRCPLCKTAAAFVGFNQVECRARCRG